MGRPKWIPVLEKHRLMEKTPKMRRCRPVLEDFLETHIEIYVLDVSFTGP